MTRERIKILLAVAITALTLLGAEYGIEHPECPVCPELAPPAPAP